MSSWFDAEREVLNRHDTANKVSRTMPLELPEATRPSRLSRFFGWLARKPQAQAASEAEGKVVPRLGH
jgi:hypothetical protein